MPLTLPFIKTPQYIPQQAEGRNAQMWLDSAFEKLPQLAGGNFTVIAEGWNPCLSLKVLKL